MKKKRAVIYLLAVIILLPGCEGQKDGVTSYSNSISAAEKGIIFVHGNTVGLVQPRCDIASGKQASWHPYSNAIVLATSGAEKLLIIAELSEEQSEVVGWKPLPIPTINTRFPVEWEWSFSPNRRWLALSRKVVRKRYWPHGLKKEASQAAQDIHWIGLVDLNTGKMRKFEFFPFSGFRYSHRYSLLGWSGQACLIQSGNSIFSIDAANPSKANEILKGGFTSIVALSPDGHKIITYDGREGNVEVKMTNFQSGAERVLLRDPFEQHRKGYGGGGVNAAFSQDSRWVAIRRFISGEGGWQVTVNLESIDGDEIMYKDEYVVQDAEEINYIGGINWSPAGQERFFYLRPSDANDEDTIVVVELQGTKVEKCVKTLYKTKLISYYYNLHPLWSPKGDYIAWLTERRSINIFDIEGDTITGYGKLPDDVTSWTWATPTVTKWP